MNSSILRMDGVPFWKSSVGNIEESILSKIYEIEKEFPTERYSNINGYQSQANIYLIEEFRPLFETVMRLASAASVDMKFAPCNLILKNAWFNINRGTSSFNKQHIHGDIFSGVLYLKCPEGSGGIEFKNPAFNDMWLGSPFILQNDQSSFRSDYPLIPEEGEVFLWPSYLPHSVMPNTNNVERISISFNISATINN